MHSKIVFLPAIVGSSSALVQLLCEKGADCNVLDKLGMKSVLMAATLNSNLDHVKILLAQGADPDYKNDVGRSALDMAAEGTNAAYEAEDFDAFFKNLVRIFIYS